MTATDVSGGIGTAGRAATVRNLAPSVAVQAACDDPQCFGFFSRLAVDDGETVTVRGRVTDPGTDDGSLVIDWGDGSEATTIDLGCGAGELCSQAPLHASRSCNLLPIGSPGCGYFAISHVYAAPSTGDGYTIDLTATDDDGGVGTRSASATVISVNDAPHVDLTGPVAVAEGSVGQFAFDVTDPDPGDTFTLVDGSPSCGVGTLVDGSLVVTSDGGTFSCRFPDGPDDTTVSVTVVDGDDVPSNVATTAVTVQNVAPAITSAVPAGPTVAEGAPVGVSVAFTDPGDDTHEAHIDWGDGTETELPSVARSGFTASHVYAGHGERTVTIRVTDSDGAFHEVTVEVAVLAHADLVTAVAAQLDTLAGAATGPDADRLRRARTALIGNNDGKAANGLVSAIAARDDANIVRRARDAIGLLDGVHSVDTTSQRRLLAGVARATTIRSVADAALRAGCEPRTAASCSPGQRKSFARIDADVADGHRRFDAGDFHGAATAYLRAL